MPEAQPRKDQGALSGSRADASSPQAVSTEGFDPARKYDDQVIVFDSAARLLWRAIQEDQMCDLTECVSPAPGICHCLDTYCAFAAQAVGAGSDDPDALTGCADDQIWADVPVEVLRGAIAAGTQSAETSETSAPSEGCQSGPKASPND